MYSRSARKFLAPDRDHANPRLGPGCYTADHAVLIAGKLVGNDGYAPFASLTPRVSFFDESIGAGPSPGAYDSSHGIQITHRKDPAATFGRSRALRFAKIRNFTPGPGTYRIPTSNLHGANNNNNSSAIRFAARHVAAGGTYFSLTQQPVGVDYNSPTTRHEPPFKPRQIQPRVPMPSQLDSQSSQQQHPNQQKSQHPNEQTLSSANASSSIPLSDNPAPSFPLDQPHLAANASPPTAIPVVPLASGDVDPPPPVHATPTAIAADPQQPITGSGTIPAPNATDSSTGILNLDESYTSTFSGPEAKGLSLVSRAVSATANATSARKSQPSHHHHHGHGSHNHSDTHTQTSILSHNEKTPKPTGAHRIIWKRKYVPPSIPAGRYAFGYQEGTDGDLIPRKPPKHTPEQEPPHLFSFVEKSKHESRGCRFTKGTDRLTYKIIDSPGPTKYDAVIGDAYLNHKSVVGGGVGPAVMTLAPCKRLTDEIVAESVKRGIPGPGAYDLKAPLTDKINQPRNRIRFGGLDERSYLNPELMKTPGPGAYYPEFSDHPKPHSHKPQPFGSTTKRFDAYHPFRSDAVPAVGTYDVDEVNSIFRQVRNRANYISLRPAAFGAVAERFRPAKQEHMPGPGAYALNHQQQPTPQPQNPTKNHATSIKTTLTNQTNKRKEQNRLQKLMSRGPTHVVLGNMTVPSGRVHMPVFGSQTDRFAEATSELPPPGAYDIANSFETLRTKGRIENTGVLASQSKRELFTIKNHVPGPGEYDVTVSVNVKEIQQKIGSFLSTSSRFQEKYERVPGPGAYLPPDYVNGLVKKTFNVTLTEWGREHEVGV